MTRLRATTLGLFWLLSFGVGAVRATPFGGDDTGEIPADAPKGPIAKCENRVGKAAGKLAAAILKCHASRVSGKLADDTAEDMCEGTAKTKFMSTKTTGCTACTNLATLAAAVESLIDSNNDKIYCTAAGAPFGGDDTGNIPPDATKGPITKCENGVGKAVGKLVASIIKCHSDRVAGKTTDDTGEDTCEGAAKTKFGTTKTASCDSCTNLTTLGNFVESVVDGANSLVYCTTTTTTTSTTTTTLSCYAFVTKWGSSGSGDGQFNHPIGVGVDGSGNVFVADLVNQRIQKFTNDGTFVTKWGSLGSGPGQFNNPIEPAVDASGNVFVVESGNSRIQKFTNDGAFITMWGSSGSGDGQFNTPLGVAVDGSGNVFVAEQGGNRVQKFTNDGTFITKWGSFGTGDGQFLSATVPAVDGNGNVFVADDDAAHGFRIQKFTNDGIFLTKWGSLGSGDGQFDGSVVVTVDRRDGTVFVTELNNHRIQKFTNNGAFLTKWGSFGTGDGQFSRPIGVSVDGNGNVFVADGAEPGETAPNNNRIQKFACP